MERRIEGTCPACLCSTETALDDFLQIIKLSRLGYQVECGNCLARGPVMTTKKEALIAFNEISEAPV